MMRERWDRAGIASRLSIVIMLILVAAGAILAVIMVHQVAAATQRELAIRLNGRVAWLAIACREPAIIGDLATIEQLLEEQSKHEDSREASFADPRGSRLARQGHPPALSVPGWFVEWLAIDTFKARRSIIVGGRSYGEVAVELAPNRAIIAAWNNLLAIGITACGALIVVVGAILFFLRRSLRPLDHLAAGARDFATGNMGARVTVEGSPEMRGLIEAFNRMAETVCSREGEIRGHRDRLEEQVARRTEELSRAKAAAEIANMAKSAFLANMSHEIRTPLNAITGMAHLIRRGGLTPKQNRQLETLEAASTHLLGVIDAILELSKIEAGKFELEEARISVARLVEDIVSMIRGRAEGKGLQLKSAVEPLPGDLLGDATRLRQALLNYASNAVKFTDAGSVTVRARASDENSGGLLVRFEVEDTGIGIDPKVIPRLFSPFEQADSTTTRRFGGTGLGLAITKRFAELMGGEAGAESVPGQGSLFWFSARLKRGMPALAPPAAQPAMSAESTLRNTHSGARILLVEDDPINLEVALESLAEVFPTVAIARDGAEAVDRVATARFDLVLMDIQMPNLDGLEATQRIRKLPNGRHVPIVAMTANAFAEDRTRCFEAGMNDFMAKPVVPATLFEMVLKWLETSRRDDGAMAEPFPAPRGAAAPTGSRSV